MELVWQKFGDLQEYVRTPWTFLSVVGEHSFRRARTAVTGTRSPLPTISDMVLFPHMFLVACFQGLHREKVREKTWRGHLHLTQTLVVLNMLQTEHRKLDEKAVETLYHYLSKWTATFDPSAVKLHGEDVEKEHQELVELIERTGGVIQVQGV